ncbi:SIR2 family protein [Methylobacterium sp. AMS5]|uniref:SIR2 family protein n=1 Tax=Methylobacterium sp. AMS5 TaxID=925818 RepID=UPI00074FA523|nr:SIR2 family protein [Methylobacterium sp. AMS5]AMB47605.1 hypothetical protein Y590_21880 [Methylobacterium sp. AMS5]
MSADLALSDRLAPFDQDGQFEALIAKMQRVRPLALIGAGASIGSGYPTWSQLLQQFQKELRDQSSRAVAPKVAGVVQDLQDPAWQAEEYHNALGGPTFYAFLSRTFAQRPPAEPHHLIARIGFRHVLTTNFETCAEDAFRQAYPHHKVKRVLWSRDDEVQDFFADLAEGVSDISIVYLHGHESDPASIVLRESDYSRTYLREENRRRLIALFMTQPIVFVGFSMNDPDLGQIMREVLFSLPRRAANLLPIPATGNQRSPARHFALFGYRTVAERDLIRRRMEGKFGLQTVFYRIVPSVDGKSYRHDNLLKLLEAIGQAAPPRHNAPDSATRASLRAGAALTQEISRATNGDTLVVPVGSDNLVPPGVELDGEDLFNLDPHKGAFGGSPTRDGLKLRVSRIRKRSSWVEFDLEVRPDRGVQFEGSVTFYYHPTFTPEHETVAISEGRAHTTVEAVGAFTVGAEFRGTRLELDLSDDNRFPTWFRES